VSPTRLAWFKRLAIAFCIVSVAGALAVLWMDGHFPAAIPEAHADVDYRPFADALSYVSPTGLVDYAALKKDRAKLDAFVASLASVTPLNRPELFPETADQLVFWLNAYHALALQAALDDGAPDSDRVSRFTYAMRTWPIGGRRLSLFALERRFLRDVGDPRVPFALACGARSCALLDGAPYQPDTLDAQLNDAVRRFFRDPSNVKIDRKNVHVSPLVQRHEMEILSALPPGSHGALQFVWAFLPDTCTDRPGCDTRADLDRACGVNLDGCKVDYLPFDWSLAARPTSASKSPDGAGMP
jgi:hypothetical protein